MALPYQLWDTETRNLVAAFETEQAALAAVCLTLRVDGREAAETLFLGLDTADGGIIAEGAALIERAEAASATAPPAPR